MLLYFRGTDGAFLAPDSPIISLGDGTSQTHAATSNLNVNQPLTPMGGFFRFLAIHCPPQPREETVPGIITADCMDVT